MVSKPQLLVWLICDAVHIDPATGKHTLLGVFSNIRVRQFPAAHPRMVWFLTVTDVPVGEHILRIRFGPNMEDMKTLLEQPFKSQNPAHRINLINEIQNLTFSQPGEHSIIVEVGDEPVLATSLTISQ